MCTRYECACKMTRPLSVVSVVVECSPSCRHRTQSLVTPMLSCCLLLGVIAPLMLYNLMPHMGHHSVTGRSYNGSHPHKCHGMYSTLVYTHVNITSHNCTVSAGAGQPGALSVRSVPAGLAAQDHNWPEGRQGRCGLGLWRS